MKSFLELKCDFASRQISLEDFICIIISLRFEMEQCIFTKKSRSKKEKINYSSRWNVKSCEAAAPNAQVQRPLSPYGWVRAGKKLPCSLQPLV